MTRFELIVAIADITGITYPVNRYTVAELQSILSAATSTPPGVSSLVSAGKTLQTKRGELEAGELVYPSDFANGLSTFNLFVSLGYINAY